MSYIYIDSCFDIYPWPKFYSSKTTPYAWLFLKYFSCFYSGEHQSELVVVLNLLKSKEFK